MTTHNFTIKEILSSAWLKTKEHAWYIFSVFVISAVLMGATKRLFLLSPIIGLFVGIAIIAVSLTIVRNETPTFNDLIKSFKNYKITWHYILASILYMLIIIVGLIAVILPGIYLAVRLQFYKFLVVDNENMKPMEALKESLRMTEGRFWKLFTFIIVIILMNILGAMLLGIGLIVTIPVTVLAHAFLYKKLLIHTHTA